MYFTVPLPFVFPCQVMALRFAREGADVLLAAKMTDKLRKELPEEVTTDILIPGLLILCNTFMFSVCRSQISLAGDAVERDDVHLIFEYRREETWGRFRSPRANRFIVHSDVNNPTVSSLEAFGQALQDYKPDLLLVSGLQMMDNFPFPVINITDSRY